MQYVTSFERLAKEEGLQQGMQKGIQQGIQQGLQKGRAGLLIDPLTHRFGPLPDEVRQRFEQASSEEINTWASRILDADSLEQVFGG